MGYVSSQEGSSFLLVILWGCEGSPFPEAIMTKGVAWDPVQYQSASAHPVSNEKKSLRFFVGHIGDYVTHVYRIYNR